mgnify:CR=1 FL=1
MVHHPILGQLVVILSLVLTAPNVHLSCHFFCYCVNSWSPAPSKPILPPPTAAVFLSLFFRSSSSSSTKGLSIECISCMSAEHLAFIPHQKNVLAVWISRWQQPFLWAVRADISWQQPCYSVRLEDNVISMAANGVILIVVDPLWVFSLLPSSTPPLHPSGRCSHFSHFSSVHPLGSVIPFLWVVAKGRRYPPVVSDQITADSTYLLEHFCKTAQSAGDKLPLDPSATGKCVGLLTLLEHGPVLQKQSSNHRIIKVGKDLYDHLVQPPTHPHHAHWPCPSVPHPRGSWTPPGTAIPPPLWIISIMLEKGL